MIETTEYARLKDFVAWVVDFHEAAMFWARRCETETSRTTTLASHKMAGRKSTLTVCRKNAVNKFGLQYHEFAVALDDEKTVYETFGAFLQSTLKKIGFDGVYTAVVRQGVVWGDFCYPIGFPTDDDDLTAVDWITKFCAAASAWALSQQEKFGCRAATIF
jgi:hypothetical protein